MSDLIVRQGRVIDPAGGIDATLDVLIRDGRIALVGAAIASDAPVLEAHGLVVTPGFVDLHVHLREPGEEHKETVATGAAAAARGGFTTICAMPNTRPPADSAAVVGQVLAAARGARARVLPIGTISQGRRGEALAEMYELREAGVVAFSDDGSGVVDAALARRAFEYAADLGLPVAEHCEDPALADGGVMYEGAVATRLGLRGRPAAAEVVMVERDIRLAELTGVRLHLCHLSTAAACAAVAAAKARGVAMSAEVAPHHLFLTDAAVAGRPHPLTPSPSLADGEGESEGILRSIDRLTTGPRHGSDAGSGRDAGVAVAGRIGLSAVSAYDTNAKVNPPLASAADVEACVEALRTGVIDAIATDHAPHASIDKECEFDVAAYGISGLETAFGVVGTLVAAGRLSLGTAIERLTIGPVRAWGLDRGDLAGLGTLREGAPGDLAILDPEARWTVDPARFASKGKNTPLAGRELTGRVAFTVLGGVVVHEERAG